MLPIPRSQQDPATQQTQSTLGCYLTHNYITHHLPAFFTKPKYFSLIYLSLLADHNLQRASSQLNIYPGSRISSFFVPIPHLYLLYYAVLCSLCAGVRDITNQAPFPPPIYHRVGTKQACIMVYVLHQSSFSQEDRVLTGHLGAFPANSKGAIPAALVESRWGIPLSNSSIVVGVLITRSVTMPGQSARSASHLAGNVEGMRGR